MFAQLYLKSLLSFLVFFFTCYGDSDAVVVRSFPVIKLNSVIPNIQANTPLIEFHIPLPAEVDDNNAYLLLAKSFEESTISNSPCQLMPSDIM